MSGQKRRDWRLGQQSGLYERVMFAETTPGIGEAQQGLAATTSEDGTRNKDCRTQGRRFSVTAGFGDLSLVESEQVVGKKHG